MGGVDEPQAAELVPQLLVEPDRGAGVPGVQAHGGVEAGGAGAQRGGVGVAAGHLVGEEELEEVGVGQLLLAGQGESLGQGVEQLAELERAQDLP